VNEINHHLVEIMTMFWNLFDSQTFEEVFIGEGGGV